VPLKRILLLLPTTTYRTADFLDAVSGLDVEVVVGSERTPALAGLMEGGALRVDFRRPDAAALAIARYARERPLDAIVPVDDEATLVAARAAAALGLPHNAVEAVAASRDKERTRECLVAAGLRAPRFTTFRADTDPQEAARTIASGSRGVAFPCVVKPVDLSGSRGVIRADDRRSLVSAFARVAALVTSPEVCPPGDRPQRILVEDFIAGGEVALEGLLRAGTLEVLAIFDKPDPLDGPYFEETIYVTPSRLSAPVQEAVAELVAAGAAALGLREGPVHAEVRVAGESARLLEVAARSIGGLCSRALRFGAGISLEEVILRHALGLVLGDLRREQAASGVMMLPIPRSGVLGEVRGVDAARSVPGVEGVELTIARGRPVRALPEGDRYLGFVFARGSTPATVETSLRRAHACLEVEIIDTGGNADGG